ncbi:protein translocase subunit SecDF [Mesobacillus jeotgali]|uniref:protein translocase subunit SecDF n=1 Tax=Mesobacillus jeotgali TaxID=129985 RepID=UPI0009A793F0|nr:protein translocase subunit SecDF [Mesobacillus jeotgali]
MVKRSRIVAFFLLIILIGSAMGATTQNILKDIKLGLDLQGGFEVLYEVSPLEKGQKINREVLKSTAEALDRRVNALGVSEPNIQIEGENRIRVQLAGVKDQSKAREMLSTEANLTFRDVNDRVMMDGGDLAENGASQSYDENNKPSVSITLKDGDEFGKVTQEILNMAPDNQLVIWLDFEEGKDSYKEERMKENPKFLSNPNVTQVLNNKDVQITGNFTVEEAQQLASLLKAGSLPVNLDEIYSTSVGAKFGEHAMDKTVLAGIIGILAIFAYMIAYYRFPGFIATITLTIYIYLTVLIFDWMNVVLTLPGIAALILGVGMAVDANIITYERIKEEIKVGKSIKSAFKAGNDNSLSTVTDANLTTLLAGVVLFIYGTSSVKGFATSLIIGILGSFFTNVYLSRWLLGLWVNSGFLDKRPGWFGVRKQDIKSLSENFDTLDLPTKFDRFDFVRSRKKFFIVSGTLLAAGVIILLVFRLNLGIDFTSGTRVEILSKEPLTSAQLSDEFEKLGMETSDIVISGDNENIGVARFKGQLSKAEISEVKSHFGKELSADTNVNSVSPTVGRELAKNALISLLITTLGLIIFVTFRFELPMAVTAIIALMYATFFIIPVFSIIRWEVDITFIAALLTIVGYAINDTIVTFDRMRENMQKRRKLKTKQEIEDVVNISIRQTLTRSVNTVLMVTLTVIALLLFGSESIRGFSIALLIGLIVGTYSSIFIAAQLWVEWKNRELEKKGVLITYKEKKKYSDEPQV